ncbi:Threonine aspartase 1 [Pleurotus pulmonarius]|nr:hypothetical protein EYR38_006604 [Pleurotus pulmonarius]
MQQDCFVAVHGGAGILSRDSEVLVKQALANACKTALTTLQIRNDANAALAATAEAIVVLEDDPCLNAGYGSNLTFAGTVECDAAIMTSEPGDYGSIGAVSGIANPIRLARAVLEHARIPGPLGRVPPMMLVSEGATSFASSVPQPPITIVPVDSLITPRARQQWAQWKARLDQAEAGTVDSTCPTTAEDQMQDTVGAVTCDGAGRMAAGVSSGGLLLKRPGRIGEAAVYGAGCWASQTNRQPHTESTGDSSSNFTISGRSMACSVSGTGEDIVRAMLARSIARALAYDQAETFSGEVDVHEALSEVFVDLFLKPCMARGELNPSAGVILLDRGDADSSHSVRLWCAFTTPSMSIAYASSRHPSPKVKILRKPTRTNTKSPVYITAISLS